MNLQRILAVLLALAAAGPAWAADPHAGAPAASPIGSPAGGSSAINKLLSPDRSDPDVPLPVLGLPEASSASQPSAGPRIYGREETGGGVLGLRFPIPVNRGMSTLDTTSSPAPAGLESPSGSR